MTPIFSIEHEGFTAKVYTTHVWNLYVEDEYFGSLDQQKTDDGNYVYKLDQHGVPGDKVAEFFKNPSTFWLKFNDRANIYWFGNNYQYEKMHDVYGPFIARKLLKEFDRLMDERETDCEDNFRVAIKGNAEQEHEYFRCQDKGCCGYIDETVVIDGVEYLIGMNYGH